MWLAAFLFTAQSLSVRPASLTLNPGQRVTLRISLQPTQVQASDPHTILELAPNGLLTVQAPPYSKDLSVLIRSRDEFVVVPVRVLDPATSQRTNSTAPPQSSARNSRAITEPNPSTAQSSPSNLHAEQDQPATLQSSARNSRAITEPNAATPQPSPHNNRAITDPHPETQNQPTPAPARLVIGLSQSGASSAQSTLHYFFDFFLNRPINDKLSIWGNIRIASAPQQLDVPIAQFAPDFLKNLSAVEVNKLALAGEFLTGVEFHSSQTLGFVAFFGASGPLTDPIAQARVFKTAPNQYLGLVPQDRDRFYRQYGAGLRYTSPETGSLTATLGQDQAVTAGRYHRPVFRIDTFYPLKRYGLYFFATATLAVAKPNLTTQPFAYELAPDIPIHDPRVTLRTVAAARDSYRIGFGFDLLGVFKTK